MKIKLFTAVLITAVSMLAAGCGVSPEAAAKQVTDYSDKANWCFWTDEPEKKADLFLVCPTVDKGKNGNFNADINSEKYRNDFVGALNMELGIYSDMADVYAPYYRQATFRVFDLDDKDEYEKYMQTAYEDVRDAFLYYSGNCRSDRPLILAGFSQGSDMVIRLMSEFFDDAEYSDRLVAAYAIGWRLTEEQTEKYPWLKPAQGEDDNGVIVTFNSEAENVDSSYMVGKDTHTYSINPLNWKTDSTPADRSLNKGACFIGYDGKITSEIPGLTGAYIDEKRGTLKVPDIDPEEYPAKIFDTGIYHIYDYQFFYRDLQYNVAVRTNKFISQNSSADILDDAA